MNTKKAYDNWSAQYDTNINKTRDLEALALQQTLTGIEFSSCLEIGCGTGKNTSWLIGKAREITAVDLSEEMLAKARAKIDAEKVDFLQADILHDWDFVHKKKVDFLQADILHDWDFVHKKYELVSFSLVLEHIEDLEAVFFKVSHVIAPGGHMYIGELHPFKQYTGSKARFTTAEGEQVVTCFDHHVSDFVQAAKKHGFEITDINEYFDDDDHNTMPRILTLLFRMQGQQAE